MSVAFRRESDEEHLEPKFELPVPPGPNYVTPDGRTAIEARVAELEGILAAALDAAAAEDVVKNIRRDLRYWYQRQSSAIPAPSADPGTVGIGSTVTFDLRGKRQTQTIVGHDEADPAHGRIAFAAPVARALLGLEAGEFAEFGGDEDALEVISVLP